MACRPTIRNFVPEDKNADKPRRMHHKALYLSPYGLANLDALKNEKVNIPLLLGGLPQANPNLVSLPAHGAPNDHALSKSSGGGVFAHYDRSYQAARPTKVQRHPGLAPGVPTKQPILVGNF
jgi:hypothetical protein